MDRDHCFTCGRIAPATEVGELIYDPGMNVVGYICTTHTEKPLWRKRVTKAISKGKESVLDKIRREEQESRA